MKGTVELAPLMYLLRKSEEQVPEGMSQGAGGETPCKCKRKVTSGEMGKVPVASPASLVGL